MDTSLDGEDCQVLFILSSNKAFDTAIAASFTVFSFDFGLKYGIL